MLAQSGFRVTLLEQAERLAETGAGIQLSPNATRILIALGLGERLRADVFVPEAVAIKTATGGRLARIPLGDEAERRYGAPYWAIHRADLQAALLEAVRANPDIVLRLGTRGRGFRPARQRPQRRLPARRRRRRRARHRADRRRRAVVGAARAARASGAGIPPAHRLARARSGGLGRGRNSALRTCSSGSGRTRMSSTIR